MGDRTRDNVATPDTDSPFTRNQKILKRADRGDERRRTREGEGIHGGGTPEAPGPLPPSLDGES